MPNSQPVDQDALDLTHAIALQESGSNGKPNYNAVGDNGTSHGAYQWQSGNFEAAAKAAGLDPTDMSPVNQDKVAYSEVLKDKQAGLDPGQIASKWNSGSPDNWQNHSGTTIINGKAIHYDTPAYVKGVQKYYQQIKGSQGQTQGQSQTQQDGTQNIAQSAGQSGGFLSDVGNTLSDAFKGVGNVVSQTATGQINPLSGVIQGLGSAAGGVTGLINDVATHLPVVGGLVKGAEGLVGQGIGALAQTAPGQAVVGAGQQFAQAHPELAGDIGGAANIAGLATGLIGGGEGLIAAKEGLGAAAAKGLLGDTVKAASDRAAFNEALDVVSPKATTAVLKKGIKAGRGALQGGVETVGPDARTIAAAKAASGIVSKGNTAVENANAVRSAIADTATGLKTELGSMEITPIVSQDELLQLRTQAMQQIGENPTMVGNAEESAKRIFTKFQSLLPQTSDVTALDVLNARQKLDTWIQSLKGSNIFDPATENAMSIALRSIRQGANNLIAEKAPGVAVKEALAKQSSLYDALDNIAAKGTKEIGTTRIKRFGVRHPILKAASKGVLRGALIGTGMKAAADLIP